jgi:hypothetical protein
VGRGSKERRIDMATFAKLLFLEAKRIRDPDGADELFVSRGDGGIFEQIRMRKDDVFEFDERFLPFVNQEPIDVVLNEVNEETDQVTFIGGTKIVADEQGLGEITEPIGGAGFSGSLYELTYKVI